MSNDTQSISKVAESLFRAYVSLESEIDKAGSSEMERASSVKLDGIKSELLEIRKVESKLSKMRQAIEKENKVVPESAQSFINQTIKVLNRVLVKIGELEKQAISAREKLVPQIHTGVKALQMKSAYGRYSS